MIAFYEARAIGGAGLIIPEITRVNDLHGAGMMRQLSVSKDRHIEGLAKLAETVRKYGTKIFIQLHHPGRETVTALTGGPGVSVSAIPCKYLQQETRALSTEEVKDLIQQFIAGGIRVKKAGWRKDLIKAVKDHVSIPVIGVFCIREPQVTESFLEEGITESDPVRQKHYATKKH